MRRILIAGFAGRSRLWAREQPDDVEIWGMNESHAFLDRADRWFQLHPRDWKESLYKEKKGRDLPERHRNTYGRGREHYEFLKRCGVPVYMNDPDPDIPTAVKYPLDEVTQRFGAPDNEGRLYPYLTSTPAWMMALAIYEGVDEIRLSGIELAIGTEYFMQRPCFEYYYGIAIGAGIKVVRPPQGSTILHAPLYPIDDPIPWTPPGDPSEAFGEGEVSVRVKDDAVLPAVAVSDGAQPYVER